jgi:DNA-binding transcriptional ArsR family regulator
MVENPAALDEVFHAIASEPRRRMLSALAEGERTVGDLAGPFEMSLAAVSKHIKVLEGAGLVERRPAGRTTICRLTPGPLAGAPRSTARSWTPTSCRSGSAPGSSPSSPRRSTSTSAAGTSSRCSPPTGCGSPSRA